MYKKCQISPDKVKIQRTYTLLTVWRSWGYVQSLWTDRKSEILCWQRCAMLWLCSLSLCLVKDFLDYWLVMGILQLCIHCLGTRKHAKTFPLFYLQFGLAWCPRTSMLRELFSIWYSLWVRDLLWSVWLSPSFMWLYNFSAIFWILIMKVSS